MISRLARLARTVLRPTAASLNATVTSSSLRVSFEVTMIPSPHRAWRTRSPSRNWRSPGMIGRAGRAGVDECAAPPAGRSVPDGAPDANASRLAARSRDGRNGLAGRRCPGRAAPLPERAPPPARIGVPNRVVRREPNARSRSRSSPSPGPPPRPAAEQVGPDHQLGRDLEQEPGRHRRLAHPPRRAAPGVREEEPPLRAGDPDVGEPPLLLELLLVVERPAVRETGPPRGRR